MNIFKWLSTVVTKRIERIEAIDPRARAVTTSYTYKGDLSAQHLQELLDTCNRVNIGSSAPYFSYTDERGYWSVTYNSTTRVYTFLAYGYTLEELHP